MKNGQLFVEDIGEKFFPTDKNLKNYYNSLKIKYLTLIAISTHGYVTMQDSKGDIRIYGNRDWASYKEEIKIRKRIEAKPYFYFETFQNKPITTQVLSFCFLTEEQLNINLPYISEAKFDKEKGVFYYEYEEENKENVLKKFQESLKNSWSNNGENYE